MKRAAILLMTFFLAATAPARAEDRVVDSEEKPLEVAAPAAAAVSAAPAVESSEEKPLEVAAPTAESSEKSLSFNPGASSYVIHAGDKLKIAVLGEKDLSDVYTVNSTGEVRFPLIEKIQAEGITLSRFRENLEAALGKDFLNNPQVEVLFEESISNSVMVLGRVSRPGSYSLPPGVTFLQMISIAGGFDISAALSSCKIMRIGSNGNTSIPVNVEAILNGTLIDVALRPGDTIYVPKIVQTTDEKDDYLNSVAVMGQITKPGNYRLTEGMTLVRLLSQAGGLSRGADSGKLSITRKLKSGGQDTQIIDVKKILDGVERDFTMQAGDVVYVPGSRTDISDIVNLNDSVTILGQVQKPSNYDAVPGLNIVQLISQAGGFTPVGDSAHVRVTRGEIGEEKQVFTVNVAAIIAGKADNMRLKKGDIVYVPESSF